MSAVAGDRGGVEVPMTTDAHVVAKRVPAGVGSSLRVLYRVHRDTDGWKIQTATAVFDRHTLTAVVRQKKKGAVPMVDPHAENPELPTNWGRWGPDDDRGTLNFITDEARARGVAEATSGQVVSLAMPITPVPLGGGFGFPGGQPMPAPVTQIMNFTGTPAPAFTDTLVINVHHIKSTHIDALVHVNAGGEVYPGVAVDEAIAGGTVRKSSSAPFAAGVTTRGVLLDLAPQGSLDDSYKVTDADLERAEARSGVRVESGDALVVRGGWNVSENPVGPVPYLTLDAVEWMADREVGLYAGDLCDEPPIRPGSRVMHEVALARLGMPLIDGAEVDELAVTCREMGRHSFLFVLGTIPVSGATGLPVNPLAIF